MQVHGQHAVDADAGQHVGDHLGGDRHPRRTRPAVLPRIAHIRDRRGDARGGSALQRIDHHQHFHQVVVGRRADRLQHEDVLAAHVLEDLDHHFAVAEAADLGRPRWMLQMLHHILGELGLGVAGKHHQPVVTPPVHPLQCASKSAALAGNSYPKNLAGEVGIEPTNAGIKIRCLTTWRLPNT